jgi:hypothetical protein
MCHFEAALAFFLLAQLAMVAGISFPATSLFAPTTLVTVHLLTIGWLTILMLGALHQFIPVITAGGAVAGTSALVSLVMIVIGLLGMEAGFLTLDGRLPRPALVALPLGGTLVLGGAVVAAVSLARTLWQARPLPFPARFVTAAIVFLFAALGFGIVLGVAFSWPDWVPWSRAFTDGLRLHLLAGLIGWFTLTAMGVSYRLLSMFTLASEERGALGTAVFVFSAGGLTVTWLLAAAEALGVGIPHAIFVIAAVVTGTGLVLYLIDMVRLYRARRRRKLELNTGMAIPALAALAASILLAACQYVHGGTEATVGALGYLFLFGWLSGLGLSQLYKIVPFLTWIERYGSVLGKQAVPRVQDLVDERRDRPWFILYFAFVAIGTPFAALGWPAAWRVAVLGHLVAALMIVRALWLVRHGTPRGLPDASSSGLPGAAALHHLKPSRSPMQ